MKLGDTIFNGNQFKNVILNSVYFKRLILGVNLVWSYFSIAIKSFKTRILADGGTYEAESILEDRLQEITPSLFDSASLVITPNGVKTSKLYIIKPNDGTGDLSVSRNTSATRIDENGNIVNVLPNVARIDYSNGSPAILVEPQRTNLLLRSQEFDNAYWTVFGSLTQRLANQTISPDGTLTADLLGFDGVGTRLLRRTAITTNNNTTYSISLFVKNNTFTQNAGTLKFQFSNNISSPNNFIIGATINFQNETLTINQNGTQGTGINGSASGSLLVLPNGWYRIQVTGTMGSAAGNSITSLEIGTFNQAGSCFVWGAQLEEGSNATSYIPTIASTVTRNADVISKTGLSGITSITETFENGTTNVISGSPTSYTMSQGRIKHVIGL